MKIIHKRHDDKPISVDKLNMTQSAFYIQNAINEFVGDGGWISSNDVVDYSNYLFEELENKGCDIQFTAFACKPPAYNRGACEVLIRSSKISSVRLRFEWEIWRQ